MQKQNTGSFSAGRLRWDNLIKEQAYTNDCVRRRYKNGESTQRLETQNPQKGRVDDIKVLMEVKKMQNSIFKPSIKMYYKNGKLNTPKDNNKCSKDKDVYRFYEDKHRPQSRYIPAPESVDNTFINEQKSLLPHQRLKPPNQRIRTQESTERVFDGVRVKPNQANNKSPMINHYVDYVQRVSFNKRIAI